MRAFLGEIRRHIGDVFPGIKEHSHGIDGKIDPNRLALAHIMLVRARNVLKFHNIDFGSVDRVNTRSGSMGSLEIDFLDVPLDGTIADILCEFLVNSGFEGVTKVRGEKPNTVRVRALILLSKWTDEDVKKGMIPPATMSPFSDD